MKYTIAQSHNCPFCDAENGIRSAWGMADEGWARMRKDHDNDHPNNQPKPQKEAFKTQAKERNRK